MPLARTSWAISIHDLPPLDIIFGRSLAMKATREKLERVADKVVPVLLQGESGTGKDVVAKFLHLQSNRSKGAWVKVTCPAIPNALVESELFGYERGAFTGAYTTKRGRVEMAHMGTLFLDEVGGLDMAVQAKMLQVLQDGSFVRVGAQDSRKVDVRLICAANGSLRQLMEEGNFRSDLFFRINAVTIDLPPLRQRVKDLPVLIDYFLAQHSKQYRQEPKPLSREMMRVMEGYHWPGNIRQLENLIRSYVLIGDEEALVADLIPVGPGALIPEIDLANPVSLKEITNSVKRNLEREIILKVLKANGWSRRKTAKWLNMSYRSLLYKLQESGIGPLRPR